MHAAAFVSPHQQKTHIMQSESNRGGASPWHTAHSLHTLNNVLVSEPVGVYL